MNIEVKSIRGVAPHYSSEGRVNVEKGEVKIKGAEDQYREAREKELEVVREGLRKAAEIKDPKQMWNAVQEIQNLLTLIVWPEAEVAVLRPRSSEG